VRYHSFNGGSYRLTVIYMW